MPTKPPLISSAPLRSAVIGVAMLMLLVGSLALALGLTGAPLLPPPAPEPDRFEFDGVSIVLPSAWGLESESRSADGGQRQWYFANAVSAAERLRVFRFNVESEADPRQVLGFLVSTQRLVAGLRVTQGQPIPLEVADVEMPAGEALDTFFAIERNAQVQTSPQIHAVRLFTPDRKRYWLFQLTDQVRRESQTLQANAGHQEQLRRIADTLVYNPTPASSP